VADVGKKDIFVWAANASRLFFSKEQMTEENTASKSLNKHASKTKQMTMHKGKMMSATDATFTKFVVSIFAVDKK